MTLTEIDNLFFEHLRREIVQGGYLPDVTELGSKAAYTEARQAIIDDPDIELIDIFGVGAGDTRGVKQYNRFTIDLVANDRGSLGAYGLQGMVKTGETWKKVLLGDTSRNLSYEIRIISQSIEYARIMEDMLNYVFGEFKFLATVDQTGEFNAAEVFIEFKGSSDVSANSQFIETIHKFDVNDIWLSRERVTRTGIVPLTTVEYFVYLKAEPEEGLLPAVEGFEGEDRRPPIPPMSPIWEDGEYWNDLQYWNEE